METGPYNPPYRPSQHISAYSLRSQAPMCCLLSKLKHKVTSWAGNQQMIRKKETSPLAHFFRNSLPRKTYGISNWKPGDGYQYCLTKAKAFVRRLARYRTIR